MRVKYPFGNQPYPLVSDKFQVKSIMDTDSFIHLARPLPAAPVSSAYQGAITTAPLNIIVHPQVRCTAYSSAHVFPNILEYYIPSLY